MFCPNILFVFLAVFEDLKALFSNFVTAVDDSHLKYNSCFVSSKQSETKDSRLSIGKQSQQSGEESSSEESSEESSSENEEGCQLHTS